MRIPHNPLQEQYGASSPRKGSLHSIPGASSLTSQETRRLSNQSSVLLSTPHYPSFHGIMMAKGVRFGAHIPLSEERASHLYNQLMGISPAQHTYGLHELMGYQEVQRSGTAEEQNRLAKLMRVAARYLAFNDEYTGEEGIKRQRVGARYLAMLAMEHMGEPWGNDALITHLREIGESQIASSLAASVLSKTLAHSYPLPLDRQLQGQQRIKLYNQLLRGNTQYPSYLLSQYAQPSDMSFLIHGLDEVAYGSTGEINLPRAVPLLRVMVATALKTQGVQSFRNVLSQYQEFRDRDDVLLSGPEGLQNKNKLQLMSRTLQIFGEQIPAYLAQSAHAPSTLSPKDLQGLAQCLLDTMVTLREDGSLLSGKATFTADGNADAIGLTFGLTQTLMQLKQEDFDPWVIRCKKLLADNVERESYARDRHLPDVVMAVMMALDLRAQKDREGVYPIIEPVGYLRSLFNLLFSANPTTGPQKDWESISSHNYERWVGQPKPERPLEGLATAFHVFDGKDQWHALSQWIDGLPLERQPLRLTQQSFVYFPLLQSALPKEASLARKVNGPLFPTPGLYHGEWDGLSPVLGSPLKINFSPDKWRVPTSDPTYTHAVETIQKKRIGFYKDLLEAWLLHPETQNASFQGILHGLSETPQGLGGFIEQWVEMFPNRLSDHEFYQGQGTAKLKLNRLKFSPDTTEQLLFLLKTWAEAPMPILGPYEAAHQWRGLMLNLFYQHPDTLPSTPWRPKTNQWFPADGSAYTPMMHTLLKLAMDTLDHTPPDAQLSEIEMAMTVFNMLKFGLPQWVLTDRQETLKRVLHVLPELARVELKDLDTDGNPAFYRAKKPIDLNNIPHPYVGPEFPWSAFYNNPPYSSAPDIQAKQEKSMVVFRNFEMMMDLARRLNDDQTLRQGLLDVLNYYQQSSGQAYVDENVIIRSLVRPEFVERCLRGDDFNFERYISASIFYKLFENIPAMIQFAAPLIQGVRDGKEPPKAARGFFTMGAIAQMGAYGVPELMEIARPESPYKPLERKLAQEILQDMGKPDHVLTTFSSMPLLPERSPSAFLLEALFPKNNSDPQRPSQLTPSINTLDSSGGLTNPPLPEPPGKRLVFRSMGSTQGDLVEKMATALAILERHVQDETKGSPARPLQELLYWVDRYQVSMAQGGARAVGSDLSQVAQKMGSLLIQTPWEDRTHGRSLLMALCSLKQRSALPFLMQAWEKLPHTEDRKLILETLAESRDPQMGPFLAKILRDSGLDEACLAPLWRGLAEAGYTDSFREVLQHWHQWPAAVFDHGLRTLTQYRSQPFAKGLLGDVRTVLEDPSLGLSHRLALLSVVGAVSERDDAVSRRQVMSQVSQFLKAPKGDPEDGAVQLKLAAIRTLYNHFDWDEEVRSFLTEMAQDPHEAVQNLAALALEESQSEL